MRCATRETSASSSPRSLPKPSATFWWWVSACAHGAEPRDPCALPPSTCFVHSPGAAPTLPDIDLVACVGFFPLLGLYAAGNHSPRWLTRFCSLTSCVPGTLAQKDLGALRMLSWTRGCEGGWRVGVLWGQGAGTHHQEGLGEGEPVASPTSRSPGSGFSLPPHGLWDGVSLRHSLLAGSRPKPPLASPHRGASVP